MTDHRDEDLRAAFRTVAQDDATIKSFADLTSHGALSAARVRRRRRTAITGVAIAIPLLLVTLARSTPAFDAEQFAALTGLDPNEVTWEAPSDFLLDYPGRDLLHVVPVVEIRAPEVQAESTSSPNSRDTTRRSRS